MKANAFRSNKSATIDMTEKDGEEVNKQEASTFLYKEPNLHCLAAGAGKVSLQQWP